MALISISVDTDNRTVVINRHGHRQILPMFERAKVAALEVAMEQISNLVECEIDTYERSRMKESA